MYISLKQGQVILYGLASVILLTISARLTIDLSFLVPLTLQTYAIGLIIVFMQPKVSLYSIFTYVIIGIIGVPVFSHNSGGIHVLLGSTGGYIIGFLVSSIFFYIVQSKKIFQKSYVTAFVGALILHAIIVSCGFVRLYSMVGYDKSLYNGLLPLICPGTLKSIMIVATYYIYTKITHL